MINPEELTPPTPLDYGRKFDALKEQFAQQARETSYPGATDGPADAYRHMLAAAEFTRLYGQLPTRVVGNYNEGSIIPDRAKLDEASKMDLHNNRIGEEIGRQAKNSKEAERLVHAHIRAAAIEGGTGANGTAIYLGKEKWGGDEKRTAELVWPLRGLATSSEVELALASPPESWSDAVRERVMRDRIYWDTNHPRQAEAFEAVRRSF